MKKRLKILSKKRLLEMRNENAISKFRKTGLFKTNEEVVDAALRSLSTSLLSEFSTLQEGPSLPSEDAVLPVLPGPPTTSDTKG